MLDKSICKMCVKHWFPQRDDILWDRDGVVDCPFSNVEEGGSFKGMRAKVNEPPPFYCPFALEQLMRNAKSH